MRYILICEVSDSLCAPISVIREFNSLVEGRQYLQTLEDDAQAAFSQNDDGGGHYNCSRLNLEADWDCGYGRHVGWQSSDYLHSYLLVETLLSPEMLQTRLDLDFHNAVPYSLDFDVEDPQPETMKENLIMLDHPCSEIHAEGYEWLATSRSVRLKRLHEVTDLKRYLSSKSFVVFGKGEIKLIKQRARRSERRQGKKALRDYLP